MGRGAEHGAEREGPTRNMQVRGAERERNAAELKKQGKRNIAPPLGGACYALTILTMRKETQSHGETPPS